jgi:hypothetical protein
MQNLENKNSKTYLEMKFSQAEMVPKFAILREENLNRMRQEREEDNNVCGKGQYV